MELVTTPSRAAYGAPSRDEGRARELRAIVISSRTFVRKGSFCSWVSSWCSRPCSRCSRENQRAHLEDLFENITLYDNRAIEARCEKRADGTVPVRLRLEAKKDYADGAGDEAPVSMDDWIDSAVFGGEEEGGPPEGRVLYLRKHRMDDSRDAIEIVVTEEPTKAGVDLFNELMDRHPEDHVTNVSSSS